MRNPQSIAVAEKFIDRLLKYPQPEILYPDETILRQTFRLMERYAMLNKRFREAQLVATLLKHGVKTLVTGQFIAVSGHSRIGN